ncbi:hypothetical protein [Glycomyces sp. MUSA5-2]|uniref:hypothetical protein n=1 Tax=Glycomyces sp. MUSA5-2 TaxID=2053002 RepID=UPI00300B9120
MNHHEHHHRQPAGSEGIDVPLSVWPVWSQSDLVGRLVQQFTAPDEIVTLLGVEGVAPVTDLGRHCIAYCTLEAMAREYEAITRSGQTEGIGYVLSIEDDNLDLPEHLRTRTTSVLTICDDRGWDASTWWALAESIPAWGLLAVLWDGPAISAMARSSCAGSGLSYAGHIVAAESSAFDRAAATAAGLAQVKAGEPRRSHTNVGLWARYPGRIDGSSL